MASYRTFLLLCLLSAEKLHLSTSSLTGVEEVDVDQGKDSDLFDINEEAGLDLVEGDIVIDKTDSRNAILDNRYRWPTTVPYYLENNLEINAKGIVLKAFEQYRLKTCIDFKPWSGEPNYISVFKGSGCYSYVGNRRVGKQELSIGQYCDHLATVEHEFLHALGFWHEQSRSDRDDYVQIVWDEIAAGREHNFNTYSDTVSSALGVPYDYTSVMHYSKTAFSKSSNPTIVTKIPEFLDVIGQRMEFSSSDILKLNKLYNCTTFTTFLDSCSFEEPNICGMIQEVDAKGTWKRVSSVNAGPNTDYTNMGQCNGAGFFMHFSTATGSTGDKAYLESRIFYPKRGFQCLQFYLYNSGSTDDKLNVWVREYSSTNPKGVLRLIQTISGGLRNSWKLNHVTLDVSQKFRVVFEGVKGKGTSQGGLSLDDINLSETKCPQHTWQIKNFNRLLATSPVGSLIYSPTFVSHDGYSFQISLYVNGYSNNLGNMAAFFYLTSGPHDSKLTWPCPWRQVTMALMDQNPHIQQRMDNQRMITTDPSRTTVNSLGNVQYYWDDPRKVGTLVRNPDGTSYYRGPGLGYSSFISHSSLKTRDFIKGDDIYFLLSLEDLTGLLRSQSEPQPVACGENCLESSSLSDDSTTRVTSYSTVVAVVCAFGGAIMMLLAVASVLYVVKRRQERRKMDKQGMKEPEKVNGQLPSPLSL